MECDENTKIYNLDCNDDKKIKYFHKPNKDAPKFDDCKYKYMIPRCNGVIDWICFEAKYIYIYVDYFDFTYNAYHFIKDGGILYFNIRW